jgi:hypothetical protein
VRRLALKILRRYNLPAAGTVARELRSDGSTAVRLEAALALPKSEQVAALLEVLQHGAARDAHLRYEAAWHLARHADSATFTSLLAGTEEERLAGLIALDVACYEDLPSKPAALEVLARALEEPGKTDPDLLLTLAQLNGDKAVLAVLEKLVMRPDLPPAVTARALLVLRARAGGVALGVLTAAGKRFLEAVEKGSVRLASASDQMLLLQLLEAEASRLPSSSWAASSPAGSRCAPPPWMWPASSVRPLPRWPRGSGRRPWMARPSPRTASRCWAPWPASRSGPARRAGSSCWPTPACRCAPRRCGTGGHSRTSRR